MPDLFGDIGQGAAALTYPSLSSQPSPLLTVAGLVFGAALVLLLVRR